MKSRTRDVLNYRLQPTVYLASRDSVADSEGTLDLRSGSPLSLPWEPRVVGVADQCGRQLRNAQPGEPAAPLN